MSSGNSIHVAMLKLDSDFVKFLWVGYGGSNVGGQLNARQICPPAHFEPLCLIIPEPLIKMT